MSFCKFWLFVCLLMNSLSLFAMSEKEKVKSQIDFIKQNVDFPFRLIYQVKISNKKDPNAYSTGTLIGVTRSLLTLVNDRELLAVIAHEMAHREKYHFASRSSMMLGGAIVAAFDVKNEDSFIKRYQGFNEEYALRQELQADCMAYQWLNELQRKGYSVSPKDLNRATTKILGIDFSNANPEIFADLPPYIRFKAIERGYEGKDCSL